MMEDKFIEFAKLIDKMMKSFFHQQKIFVKLSKIIGKSHYF